MSAESLFKILCPHCSNGIEFPASAGGETVECPHCKGHVLLKRAPAPVLSRTPRRRMRYATVMSLIFLTCAGVWWTFGAGKDDPGFLAGASLFVIFIIGYMFPTIVAQSNEHRNASAIGVLNLLLGWIIALVWACTDQKK